MIELQRKILTYSIINNLNFLYFILIECFILDFEI